MEPIYIHPLVALIILACIGLNHLLIRRNAKNIKKKDKQS